MRLIVAEKPSVGRDLANALGRHRKEKGALTGQGWTVTWALGHLAELAPPDAYGEEYKKWRLERDRKSTRLNSSHANISYAVFCLKKKNSYQAKVRLPVTYALAL